MELKSFLIGFFLGAFILSTLSFRHDGQKFRALEASGLVYILNSETGEIQAFSPKKLFVDIDEINLIKGEIKKFGENNTQKSKLTSKEN